ncbi:MAG: type II secretion system protein [Phycisphaerae bacterium]|nr:type II secretion system protein [Phycisphaerae bacterium]
MSVTIPSVRRSAFTLVELLVVVAILGVLMSLVLVGVSSMDDSAMSTTDLARQRQIALAEGQYAAANDGRLFHPRTAPVADNNFVQPPEDNTPSPYFPPSEYEILGDPYELAKDVTDRLWVRAYNDGGNTRLESLDGNSYEVELTKAFSDGAAWEYLDGNIDTYLSPLDQTGRMRSYAINSFIGVNVCADDWYFGNGYPMPFANAFVKYAVPTPTMMHIKQPSKTMCTIGEDDPGIGGGPPGHNGHGFMMHPNQDGSDFANYQTWIDIPGLWNPGAINISHMDGSTESIKLTEPNLYDALDATGDGIPDHWVIFDGPDLQALQRRILPGVLEYRSADDLPD